MITIIAYLVEPHVGIERARPVAWAIVIGSAALLWLFVKATF